MRRFAWSSLYSIGVVSVLILGMVMGIGRVSGAPAADGDLDLTFGTGGKVTTSFPGGSDVAKAVVLQPDQKIVTAGSAGIHTGLARYMPDGTLDSTFGAGGKVVAGFDWLGDGANAIALQRDGKIVTAGQVYTETYTPHFALMRFNSDGSLDPTFGTGGKVITVVDSISDQAWAVAVQPDGKIVAVGAANSTSMFAVARYTPGGLLDQGFGSGGIVITHIENGSQAFAVALQSDGKIVAGGYSTPTLYDDTASNFALARYMPDGTLDPDFGTGGVLTTDFGYGDEAHALALQPDGKIVAAGFARATQYIGSEDFAVASYNSDGSPDEGFGTGGKVTVDFSLNFTQRDQATSLIVQTDGKVVAAGYTLEVEPDYHYNFALARFDTNGALDSTFGKGGKVTTTPPPGSGQANALALQSDGKLVAAGFDSSFHFSIPATSDVALVRYTPTGDSDSSFGTDGVISTDFAAGDDSVRGLAIQSDGKIVAAGWSDTNGGDFGLARYLPDGSLDIAFGTGGKVTTDFTGGYDQASAVALQPDGKIVVAGTAREILCNAYYAFCPGSFAVVRYNSDGSLDTSFGTGGKTTTDVGYGGASGMALQSDGKIVVVGTLVTGNCVHYCTSALAVVRYNSDGSPDTGFGDSGDGEVTTNFDGSVGLDSGSAVAIQTDGSIVAAGYADVFAGSGSAGNFGLVRYKPDGSLDQGFGLGGKLSTDFYQDQDGANTLLLRHDGRIVLGGHVSHAICIPYCVQRTFFGLTSYNSDGSPDTTFGDGGKVVTDFPGYSSANAITLQADGKIVAAGAFGGFQYSSGLAIARYLGDGTLDPSFGTGGKVTTTFGGIGGAYAVAMQPDGKIVLGGQGDSLVGGLDFAIVRYKSDLPPPPTPTTHPGRFQDVPPSHPFYTYIECMGAQGVLSGYNCGGPGEPCGEGEKPYFRPENSVTRGQVTKMVSIAAGINDPIGGTQQTFTDVTPDSPFWLWVERLAGRGYIGGYACGGPGEPCDDLNRPYFRPGYSLTRGQLAKIDSNAAGYTGTPTTQTFTDVPPTNDFYAYIEHLSEHGVISGYACGGEGEPCDSENRPYFRPSNDITRGQTAKIVTNTFFPSCQ